MNDDSKKSFVQTFFSGTVGIGKLVLIVLFALVLIVITANIFTGIGLAAIALYVWMLQGEIDALHNRLKRLEHPDQQPKIS